MVSPIRRLSVAGIGVLAGIMVLSAGCASRKYVRLQTEALEPSIQEAQNGVKENAERIDAVDRRAQQGVTAAGAADTKATQAQTAAQNAATAAQAADRKADTANQGVQQANNRISTIESRIANLGDNYAESDKQVVMFKFNSSVLDAAAKSTLDRIAGNTGNGGYMLEIQGYTDARGSEQYNIGLSERRAEAVQRYLVSKKLPLYRISIVGLGKEDPVADNKNEQGRAQNRRVEVRLLKSTGSRQTN
ncbi:MAG TPA: OmpA family protein [Terriglobia bacterium]|jgi:outer membrane protein OmpA-like peptidoglycan-associated protein